MKKYTTKKEKGFVQIPNSILSDPNISFKAKSVLAIMLSLPDNWDFSVEGINDKCKEGKDCIGKAINELIDAGYVKRTKIRGDDGRITKWDYEVFENPYQDNPDIEKLEEEIPVLKSSVLDNQSEDIPNEENEDTYNTIINKKENNNIYKQTQSYPIISNLKKSINKFELEKYHQIIKNNIDYDILIKNNTSHKKMIDEIIEIMVETICSSKDILVISGEHYNQNCVKEKFLKINSGHMEYIIERLSKNTTKIGNIKQYILATVFNAPSTIDSFYTTLASRDIFD